MRFSPRELVRRMLADATSAVVGADATPRAIPVERAKRAEHGDFSSNIAMIVAKAAGRPPRATAEAILAKLPVGEPSELIEAGVAGPGFINLRLSESFWQRAVKKILKAGADWGRGDAIPHPRILLEFLSANPTGPLHVAHGRHAAVGDSLGRLMRFAGYDVAREFYCNDAGNQVQVLALSVWTRYAEALHEKDPSAQPEVKFPEEGYKGGYVRDFGQLLLERDGAKWAGAQPPADLDPIKRFAIDRCLGMIRDTCTRFGVEFDVWQSERELHEAGEVLGVLGELEKSGFVDRKDDAVWLRTTALSNDEKDRVLVKSDGLPTYLLADIAYHRRKLERGYDELIDIWGADHHGHIPRMRAGLKGLGRDPEALRVLLIQIVKLLRGGQEVKMGKRAGEFVTLDDLVEEVGRDATRFFYLMRRHDTPLDFDMELAKKQSLDNPVYYAQYAHARCKQILRRAEELQAPRQVYSDELVAQLKLPEEIAILRRLCEFPDYVADAAAAREPHRLTQFVQEIAAEFQSYYTRLQKVLGDPILPQERHRSGDWRATWDWEKTAARLLWVEAIAQVLHNALDLLGVTAPDSMPRAEDQNTKEDEA